MQPKTADAIAARIREDIGRGALRSGDALPSIRDLAASVKVNRNTAASAYTKLVQAGLIESRGRGMRVAIRPFSETQEAKVDDDLINLADGNPDPLFLPSPQSGAMNALSGKPVLYGAEPDEPELVAEFQRLARLDGLPFEGVMVMPGTTESIGRVLTEYVQAGDHVIVEDPCYMKVLYLLRSIGVVPIPVPMERDGMNVEVLAQKITRRTKVIILTPRAQNPTSISYSKRRMEDIRQVLHAHPQLMVVEDEHLGPLSLRPYHSAISSDREHWAIFRSTAKYLGPDYRIAAMLASQKTTQRMKARRVASGHWVSHILQKLALAVWREPQTGGLITQARLAYEERRKRFMAVLAEGGVAALGDDGLFVWLKTDHCERVAARLYRAGWSTRTGADFCIKAPSGLRITTASLTPQLSDELAALVCEQFSHNRPLRTGS